MSAFGPISSGSPPGADVDGIPGVREVLTPSQNFGWFIGGARRRQYVWPIDFMSDKLFDERPFWISAASVTAA